MTTNDQIRPRYKQTDVGLIPEDWDILEAFDLDPFITSGSRGWAKFYAESGALFIRITNLCRGFIYPDLTDQKLVDLPLSDTEGRRTALRDGDILISITADIGIIGYVNGTIPKPAYINQHIACLRLHPEKADSRFQSYYLASHGPQRRFAQMTDVGAKSGINLTTVGKLKLLRPPLPEQRAIAAALSDADALIASLDALIAKKRDLKQATMQQLLTGKTRLPGFTGHWETKRLGDCLCSRPKYGVNAPAVPYSDKLPTYIRITDITEDGRFSRENPVSVSSPFSNEYLLEDGDLVFARTGASVGKSYLYRTSDGPLVFAGFLIRIAPDPKVLIPKYLSALVTTSEYWDWVRLMSTRSGQPGINSNEYQELPVLLPLTNEQAAIAAVLSDMDADLIALEANRDKAHAIKQSMMQELLTGRIRLTTTETNA